MTTAGHLKLETPEGTIGGYRASPAETARGGLVVIQEIFGVNPHIRSVVDEFARHGYRAIAPALMDFVEPGVELDYDAAGVARGRDLMAKVGFERALAGCAAARAHLAGEGLSVGAVGYCIGGSIALLCNTRLRMPAVSYYGGRSMDLLNEQTEAPLMLHFGERDPLIPAEHIAAQRTAFPNAEIHVYAAGHGFNCAARADHDPEAAALALRRTLDFFGRHLR